MTRRQTIKQAALFAIAVSAAQLPASAMAATVVTSIDTNSSWTVTNLSTGVTNAAAVPPLVPFQYNGGILNPSTNGARWISPTNTLIQSQNTTFAFTKVFSLPALANAASAVLSGNYWSDNGIVSILLNGNVIFGPVAEAVAGAGGTFSSANGQAAPTGAGQFVYGTNTVVFNVRNGRLGVINAPNPVALKGDLAVTAAVPEPGTWLLMLLGFGAIGLAMRTRTKVNWRFAKA